MSDGTGAVPAPARPLPCTPTMESLHAAAREFASAAAGIHEAARSISVIAFSPRLALTAVRSPRTGARAWAVLCRALFDREGLGWAPVGRGLAGVLWLLGVVTGRESLAVGVAVAGLKVRIRAAAVRHPELLSDQSVTDLLRAIENDRQIEAARIFMHMIDTQGAEHSLTMLAPSFNDILAWNAITDENPFNDASGWAIATGQPVRSESLLGTGRPLWAPLDRGPGRAERLPDDPDLLKQLDTSGSITGLLLNIQALGNQGLLLTQTVTGPDGQRRLIVQLPGMAIGAPAMESPADLAGAFHAVDAPSTPYSRAVAKALDSLGLPVGTETVLIGHSHGGIIAMNLAGDRAFNNRFTLTHVVAIGAPIDYKRALDPHTKVFSLVNEHDIIPSLEGRSSVSPFPVPDGWTEFTWNDTHHSFPLCHGAARYAANLESDVPEARDQINAALARYHGRVTHTALYRLHDR